MVEISDNVLIPLSDGTNLSARIWFPKKEGCYPAILEYHPYPKRYVTADRDEIGHGYFAAKGYVSIRVDMRGSGDSEGFLSDEYTEQARLDALEVISWIANQPWSSGSVGMYGLSWGGYNAIQLATMAPEALKAIAVAGATDDRYANDTHFLGGAMASEHVGWAVTLLSFLTRPPDPEIVGADWKSMWLERLEKLECILPTWLEHPTRDEYWTRGFPRYQPEGLGVPTLIAGGVSDVYINAILRMVERQPDRVKGVIGPWGHHFPHRALPGPSIDWLNQCTRWFDRWLKLDENGVEDEPPLRVFVTDNYVADGYSERQRSGKWISINHESISDAHIVKLGLGEHGKLGANWEDGAVVIDSPMALGMSGGEFMPMGWGVDLPSEQRSDDALSVCFETEALAEDIEVIGKPRLQLILNSSKPSAFIIARLCDVAPDGKSTRLAIGAHELSTSAGTQSHAPLCAETNIPVEIEMGAIAHRFVKGQRIRLALSNAYWPMFWPSNQGDILTLLTNEASLLLPTPSEHKIWNGFASGDGNDPLSKTVLSPPIFERELTRSLPRGKTTYRIMDSAPRMRFDDHKLETWNTTTRIYHIDDEQPGQAKMTIQRDLEVGRHKWHVSTRVEATISSTAEEYSSNITLMVKQDSEVLFKRQFQSKNPRHPS